jgi:AraC-like DNA-binding protein
MPALVEPVAELPAEEKKKTYLSAEQGAAMKAALEAHMQQKKPYLKPGYSIAQLSQELDIPSYQLSGFINQQYAKNFNELINEYRVDYLVHQIKGKESLSQFTLEAIGREVGFNSRAAFIAAVRKVTGKTPSEVLGRRGKEAEVNT